MASRSTSHREIRAEPSDFDRAVEEVLLGLSPVRW
jgi:hypothetical protein